MRILLISAVLVALAGCVTPVPPPAEQEAVVAPDADADATPATVEAEPLPEPRDRPPAPGSVTDPAIPLEQRKDNFVAYAAANYGVDAGTVRAALDQAEFQQSIVDAMGRPAEKVRTWADYRPIFMTDARISGGQAFYREHRESLERVAAATGVPAEYIVSIIGVETSYGRITGNYRVLDALYTLAFHYPKRAPFFAAELAHLFALSQEEHIDVATIKGSYAGAMGWGQFMPSSYRIWGKDGDGDGRRDLLGDTDDIFASIANYFSDHGWVRGQPVAARAERDPGARDLDPDSLKPRWTLAELAKLGYVPRAGEPVPADAGARATLVGFDGAEGREYWIGYRNFYVITRYNHSPMYAMAVHQLAQAIRGGVDADAASPTGNAGA
jgi:membrane-bound lytic murein transglycosylase B